MKIWTRTEYAYYRAETYLDEETGRHLGGRMWCPYRPHDGAIAWALDPERKPLGKFTTQGLARMAVEAYWAATAPPEPHQKGPSEPPLELPFE